MTVMFADRLAEKLEQTDASIIMGLDPTTTILPKELLPPEEPDQAELADIYYRFNCGLIDAVHDLIPAVKPQFAFYERLGEAGVQALIKTINYAKQHNLLVLGDAKRGDIASTAQAYADSQFDPSVFNLDAVTVNPYLGWDSISPYETYLQQGKGIYLLVRTSNPSAGDVQDMILADGRTIYQAMAEKVARWGKAFVGASGYSSIGAVVGATWPQEAKELRLRMPQTPFLIPGYGTQGGDARGAVAGFAPRLTDLVNASRSIMGAHRKHGGDFKTAAREEVLDMRQALQLARRELK